VESEKGYDEGNPLGGHDPYSSSKACAEIVASAYRRSFLAEKGIAVATSRSGNVIGGGDWSRDRVVPDAVNAFINRESFLVRRPKAVRPWQHVLEPLAGYLLLCQELFHHPAGFAEAWNFGPRSSDEQTVGHLADLLVECWGESANWISREDPNQPHEADSLKLDCFKAKTKLGWQPQWSLSEATEKSVTWYKKWQDGANMKDFSMQQIKDYQKAMLG
jgi:CDP-glucose 4,6-dehydratase